MGCHENCCHLLLGHCSTSFAKRHRRRFWVAALSLILALKHSKMRVLLSLSHLLLVLAPITSVSAFQPIFHGRSSTARHGIFDRFIESMEAGYKGEESAYQKQKAFDAKKREQKRKQVEERKARGFTKLSDVQGKTFAKVEYEAGPEPQKQEKKFFGLF